jgi:hypothetical protein
VPLVIGVLLVVTLFRLWFATRIELVPDEAYYWLWSKHLAASYRDKGPAIAWTIALGTWLFGDTVFGIRFFAVLLSTATGWLIFSLARRLYGDRTALWCLGVALVMPLFAVGAILMTIDSLSVFSWAWALAVFWRALESRSTAQWFWLGLIIGFGFLAKFTNGVQLACIALFLLWSREHRPYLFGRRMLLLCAAFGLSITPMLWWNIQNGWVHAMALHSRSGVKESFGVHPLELLEFVGGQFAVVSPLFMGHRRGSDRVGSQTTRGFTDAFSAKPIPSALRCVSLLQSQQGRQSQLDRAGAGHRYCHRSDFLAELGGAPTRLALGHRRCLRHRHDHDGRLASHGAFGFTAAPRPGGPGQGLDGFCQPRAVRAQDL